MIKALAYSNSVQFEWSKYMWGRIVSKFLHNFERASILAVDIFWFTYSWIFRQNMRNLKLQGPLVLRAVYWELYVNGVRVRRQCLSTTCWYIELCWSTIIGKYWLQEQQFEVDKDKFGNLILSGARSLKLVEDSENFSGTEKCGMIEI